MAVGVCLLLPALLGGCATLMDGTTQKVTFQSKPEGATVAVNGRVLGKAPLTAQIDRGTTQWVSISMDGYLPETRPLTTQLNGWFWGNIPLGGIIIGMAVDGMSGAANDFIPTQYTIALKPQYTFADSMVMADKKFAAMEFIVTFRTEIMNDLAKGGGRYLSTLFETLKIPRVNQNDAIDRIRTLSEIYHDTQRFAEMTVDDLMQHGYSTGHLAR
jgi:hypothetical protein